MFTKATRWPAHASGPGWIRAEDAVDGGHDVRIAIKTFAPYLKASEILVSVDGGEFESLALNDGE